MKYAYVRDNTVIEIIPNGATPIEKWYNKEFASHCQEVSDVVEQHWKWDIQKQIWCSPDEKAVYNLIDLIKTTFENGF